MNDAPSVAESDVQRHWETIPVCENIFGTLRKDFCGDHEAFFRAYDDWLYSTQGHILKALDKFPWRGRRVLEIGLGQGADSEQLIRRGARWSGIDLTAESVSRLRQRLSIRHLPHEDVVQGSALRLPFPDERFDAVYSHGVLHHIPDIKSAQREIRRILKRDGRLIMMVYARNSLNYQISIKWLRRLGLVSLYVLPIPLTGIYASHKQRAREMGLWRYLKLSNFIHHSTDGPENPYSKVYNRRAILADFPDFEIVRTFKLYMHAPPLPVHGLPGAGWLGWHLWAELRPRT
jgi:ubiquinone/menaquinone biosynthesis C-methylase UbiE